MTLKMTAPYNPERLICGRILVVFNALPKCFFYITSKCRCYYEFANADNMYNCWTMFFLWFGVSVVMVTTVLAVLVEFLCAAKLGVSAVKITFVFAS